MANVSLRHINKIYPNKVQAVFDFNLEIQDKEFIVFVGPSGCGKSTTLRMIAGLEEITSGELIIDNEIVNDVPAKDRGIAMVFQSYALYPHMTVYDNMAFGLKLRKVPKEEIKKKVTYAAEVLGLTDYLKRKPKALSGGQRQRVALGRAIIRDAKVFLYDEPLSNLDAKLRVQMRSEIAKLHKQMGATSIYVTHDQIEAMTMATRIVVMKSGHIQQIGTPQEIYENPANIFVGGFIGTPSMNFIDGVVSEDGTFKSTDSLVSLKLTSRMLDSIKDYVNKPVSLGIRPENMQIVKEMTEGNSIEVTVDACEMLGYQSNVYFYINDKKLVCVYNSMNLPQTGEKIVIDINVEKCHIFDLESTNRIY